MGQTAQTRAYKYLRELFPTRYREIYLEVKEEFPGRHSLTSIASSRLSQERYYQYTKCRDRAIEEGYPRSHASDLKDPNAK